MRKILLFFFLSVSCGAVEHRHIEQAVSFELEFSHRYRREAPPGESWYVVERGSAPILVVAGHATSHWRENTLKSADAGTASLAYLLHELCDVSILVACYQAPSDPNYYDDNALKQELATLITQIRPILVLDLHAASPSRGFQVDLGTMHGKAVEGVEDLYHLLTHALKEGGLIQLSENFFSASRQATMTKWAVSHGVPAVQIEINARLLPLDSPIADHAAFYALVAGLESFLWKARRNFCYPASQKIGRRNEQGDESKAEFN